MEQIIHDPKLGLLAGAVITILIHAVRRRSPSETLLASLRDEGLPVLLGGLATVGAALGAGASFSEAANAGLVAALAALGLSSKKAQP